MTRKCIDDSRYAGFWDIKQMHSAYTIFSLISGDVTSLIYIFVAKRAVVCLV